VPILSEDKDLNRWHFCWFLVHKGPTIDFRQYMLDFYPYIRWMSLGRVSSERFKPMLEIRKEYLEHALQEIDSQYHSLDQYLIEGCGVDQHCLEKVRYLLRGNSDKN